MTARTSPRPHPTLTAPRPDPTGRGSSAAPHRSRDAKLAGVLLSLAGAAILLGFITAEVLYPGVYTTYTTPSATWEPPSRPTASCCSPRQPSSTSPCWSPGP
jgi:hypothetical protein